MSHLLEMVEKPCVLTVTAAATGSGVRLAGILRSYYSLNSLHGWALVPPQQHGGFAAIRMTELNIDEASRRHVVSDARGQRLRYAIRALVFELERDDALLTGPPRTIGTGRYLYVGGRRRPAPEPWMLH
ncbi:MAG: hypothetical protein JO225_04605 [Candidatus Eremiobacteraeota bacterium]|nr:hypothetical protein [Candidatus Eremiobacteraeota bacterium]